MECRTSLFTTIPADSSTSPSKSSPPSSLSPTRSSIMSRRSLTPPISDVPMKPSTATKVRVPLPKNVVLLSLMEAIEFADENALRSSSISTKNVENDEKVAFITSNTFPQDFPSSDSQEESEIDKISLSTSIIAGACGTYAVACKQGLTIIEEGMETDLDHHRGNQRQTSNPWDNEINDYLQRVSSNDLTPENGDKRSRGRKKVKPKLNGDESMSQMNQMNLCFGDRVQVVSIADGWAKLARGYGFIKCNNATDLVKVGGPVDKACSLEAIINSLSLQRNRIKSEQTRLERIALVALREFQISLVRDEDLTVISSEAFDSPLFKNETVSPGSEKTLLNTTLQPVEVNRIPTINNSTEAAPSTQNKSMEQASSIAECKNSTKGSTQTDYLTNGLVSAARRLLTDYGWNSVSSRSQTEPQSSSAVSMAHTPISPAASRALLAGAESWRRRNGREAARGIDFRTGMSGHLGIQGHHAHPHDYVTSDHNSFPKMSLHSGLTVGPSQNHPR